MTALRLVALWVVLFAVYAAGLGIDARSGDELVHLGIAQALIHQHTVVDAPQGAGFALLIAPARELGGARAVELALAAIAHAGAIYPELTAGTLLAGAALCAVTVREGPKLATAIGGGALLAVLPWLGPLFVLPAAPIALALYRWCRRGRRPLLGLLAVELVAASLVAYATLNEHLYGGPTPWSAEPPGVTGTGAQSALDYAGRAPRLVTLWIDPDAGLLRWAPIFALVFFAAWLLWRSRRTQVARVIAERATAEATATLALAVVSVQLLVAAFLVPAISGDWFAARALAPALPLAAVLVSWGLRHAPRPAAVLGAITVAASAWVLLN